MTVEELIAELSDHDPEQEVYFSYDFGDRPHTHVAEEVRGVDETFIEKSSQHQMFKVIQDDKPGSKVAIVLSSHR